MTTSRLAALILPLILAACTSTPSAVDDRVPPPSAAMKEIAPSDAMMTQDTMITPAASSGVMMKNESADTMPQKPDTMAPLSYEAYSPEQLAAFAGERVALFFHADWCPTCRALDSEITTHPEQLAGAHLLKVDYDNATDLKKMYGVTTQHTLVFLNADGSLASKKLGATTADIAAFFAK